MIVVRPDTVIGWHRKSWKAYWRWRSRRPSGTGRRKIDRELRKLIGRMARENPLWGQRRIQAELARLGFSVCARTVARYMRQPYSGTPSPGGISREPPRCLIHDRDSSFGAAFNRRVASLKIKQIRTPVKAPKANAIAERWVRSIREECLDHRLIFGHQHLQRTVDEYATYYNHWRPHRSLGQIAPCPHIKEPRIRPAKHIIAKPVLGGLHHVYQWAA